MLYSIQQLSVKKKEHGACEKSLGSTPITLYHIKSHSEEENMKRLLIMADYWLFCRAFSIPKPLLRGALAPYRSIAISGKLPPKNHLLSKTLVYIALSVSYIVLEMS